MNQLHITPPLPGRDYNAGLDRALIGPHDGRIQTYDTRRYPFNTVCHLLRDFGSGRWLGASGVLIAPNIVLTAAHCLYKHTLQRGPVRLHAVPARSGRNSQPFGRIKASHCFVPLNYIKALGRSRRRYDYGLVILQPPLSRLDRFMPLRSLDARHWRSLRQSSPLTVCGYPSDKPLGTQWFHRERLRLLTLSRLFYTVDTCPGHSGSPVWARLDGQPVLVGVHTTGVVDRKGRSFGCKTGSEMAPRGMLNSGVRLTPAVISNIKAAIQGRTRQMTRIAIK